MATSAILQLKPYTPDVPYSLADKQIKDKFKNLN